MTRDQLLYHYCGTQTGFAILQKRQLRLSALSSANDTLEGRVLGRVFTQLLQEMDLSKNLVDIASVIVEGYPDSTEGFAFCLSEHGDLLSQWRSYGRDGSGIAIGFSAELLAKDFGEVNFGAKFFELKSVNYGEVGLRTALKPVAEAVRRDFATIDPFLRLKAGMMKSRAMEVLADRTNQSHIFEAGDEKTIEVLTRLLECLAPLHFQIYETKPDYFHEEREWRLLRYRHKVAFPEVEYVANDNSVRPFITCLIADPAKEAIQEIVLGPKLNRAGFAGG